MKRSTLFLSVLTLALAVLVAPRAWCQNHAEVGAFADYYHEPQTGANFAGLGGRFAGNVAKSLQLEAEMSYDFSQVFTEGFEPNESDTVTFSQSHLTVLHGLFGPKLQTPGRFRLFVTAKGGFINFRLNPQPASFSGFTSSVGDLRSNNVDAVFYPGGGLETFIGPIGLRLEAGDEMYFDHGGIHNGLRITVGPTIRF